MARPTKYKKEYCEELKKHMATGRSFKSFQHKVGVGKRTLYDWVEKHPEFAFAKDLGKSAALELFENILMANILGKDKELPGKHRVFLKPLKFILATRYSHIYGCKPSDVLNS